MREVQHSDVQEEYIYIMCVKKMINNNNNNKRRSTLSSNLQLRNIPRTVDFILMTLNRDQTKRGDKTNKAHTKNVPVLFVSVECYSSVHFFQSYECVLSVRCKNRHFQTRIP